MEVVGKCGVCGFGAGLFRKYHKECLVDKLESDLSSEIQMTVRSFSDEERDYLINAKKLTCDCPDFIEDRLTFTTGDPRRLCKHLIKAITESNQFPLPLEPYRSEIHWCEERSRGFAPFKFHLRTNINDREFEMFAHTYDEVEESYWVTIFSKGKRYAYNPEIDKWAYSKMPESLEEVIEWIKDSVQSFSPKELREGSIKTIYSRQGKTKISLQGKVGEKIIRASLKPGSSLMEMELDGDWKFTLNLETKENTMPKRIKYMEKAVTHWIAGIFERNSG